MNSMIWGNLKDSLIGIEQLMTLEANKIDLEQFLFFFLFKMEIDC
jgi:hypothetical protein